MRLNCKVLKAEKKRMKEMEAEILRLRAQVSNTTNNISNSNNTTNNNTTNNNNITNNININLPEGQWSRILQKVMVHLISKIHGGSIQQPGELDFKEAFQKTLSVAYFHPESPIYNSVEMLGRKESWMKHNGKLVRKNKLLKNINQEHYKRLIQFMKDDNERYRKELPPVNVIENWIEVNHEIISHIKKYDPCDRAIIQDTEEILRNGSLLDDYDEIEKTVYTEEQMDRLITQVRV